MLNFGTFDEAENHEALHLWIGCIDGFDDAFLASFQGSECIAVDCHKFLIMLVFQSVR